MSDNSPQEAKSASPKPFQHLSFVLSVLSIGFLALYGCIIQFLERGYSESEALTLFSGVMFVITVGLIVGYTKLRRGEQWLTIDYLNLGIQRYVLAVFMVFYGVPKLLGNFFDYQLSALDTPMGLVKEFELAWYFYGLNPWQELFAGMMEFVPGVMLLHRRTYYLGALLLLPVVGQVFLLNFFFAIGGITFPAAVVLLMCNLFILASEQNKITAFFRSLDFTRPIVTSSFVNKVVLMGRWLVLILCVYLTISPIMRTLNQSEYSKKYEALVGTYSLDHITLSGQKIDPGNDERYYKDLYVEKQARWNMLRRFNNKTDAFILRLTDDKDGFSLKINAGGTGDRPNIIVEESALIGRYQLDGDRLVLRGKQYEKEIELIYHRRPPKPKQWFW